MNVLYLHSHDTGRHVEPYGYGVPTPNIARFAAEGRLYRQAFAAATGCSPSRAALLTGEYSHVNGMLGLAHRGWRLHDYSQHIVHPLRRAGYTSTLIGEQHISRDPAQIGYDQILAGPVGPAAAAFLAGRPREPFFASVGFYETHRPYPAEEGGARPPANLPDVPETRRDMAGFVASARALDDGVGMVLAAVPDGTLVILTTDHGLPFPGAKATLTDRGLGVMLMIRGPGFDGESDALVSQLDLYPTICELAGVEPPPWARGRSLLRGDGHDALFAEMTFHAAYEPQRAVRTRRYKYIRRYENVGPVLANIDDSPSKDYLIAHGLADRAPAAEQLYGLVLDPEEAVNLAGDPACAGVLADLRDRLEDWMGESDDPLRHGPVEPVPGAVLNRPDQRSPDDPATVAR